MGCHVKTSIHLNVVNKNRAFNTKQSFLNAHEEMNTMKALFHLTNPNQTVLSCITVTLRHSGHLSLFTLPVKLKWDWSQRLLTGVLGTLWLLRPSGVEFSEEVDSWRVRGLWRDECRLASDVQGLFESRNSFGVAGRAQEKHSHWDDCPCLPEQRQKATALCTCTSGLKQKKYWVIQGI